MSELFEANEAIRRDLLAENVRAMTAWTKSLQVEPGAVLLPQTTFRTEPGRRPVANGGVYTAAGRIIASAVHRSVPFGFVPDHWPGMPRRIGRLAGTWLFGGLLRSHFGHFMIESLARLWGAAERQPLAGIVYLQFNGAPREGDRLPPEVLAELAAVSLAQPFVRETVRLLCGELPIRVVGGGVQVDELVIPSQLIGNVNTGDLAAGHPDFRAFITGALRPPPTKSGARPRRLYVSRARLPAECISFPFEDRLEQALAAEGYEILYPERLSVAEQVAAYAAASHLVLPTGSAIHLAAYALTGVQRVAVIEREPHPPPKFVRQLELFGAREVQRIQRVWAVIEDRRGIAGGAGRRAPSHILDLDAVWADLLAGGFVSRPARFDLLRDEVLAGAVASLQAQLPDARLAISPCQPLPETSRRAERRRRRGA